MGERERKRGVGEKKVRTGRENRGKERRGEDNRGEEKDERKGEEKKAEERRGGKLRGKVKKSNRTIEENTEGKREVRGEGGGRGAGWSVLKRQLTSHCGDVVVVVVGIKANKKHLLLLNDFRSITCL